MFFKGIIALRHLSFLVAVLMEIYGFWEMPEDGNLEKISVYCGRTQRA
jgi:hypothetical protein